MDTTPSLDPMAIKAGAGVLGGVVALTLDLPKSRMDLARRLFVAAVCGWAFPGPTLRYFGVRVVDPTTGRADVELILAVGLLWGFFGWFILGLFARYFIARQHRDALDVAREIKDAAIGKDVKP